MVIERDNENVIITLNVSLLGTLGMKEVQQFADYFRLLESNAQNQGTQEQVDELAREVNKKWWSENKHRFIK
jgi:hypothetical protein